MVNRPSFALVRLKKLKTAPQSKYLLRLLAALNDLDSLVVLSHALKRVEQTDYLRCKRHDGASLFLLRQQSAIVYSALYDCISTINEKIEECRKQRRTSKTPPSLWNMIISDEELSERLAELNTLFTINAASFGYVRNQLSSHIDLSAVSNGLARIVEKKDFGILYANKDWSEFRALFIDETISESWQKDAFSLELKEDPSAEQMAGYSETIFLQKAKTAEFTHSLFMKYCLQFDIFGDENEREQTSAEIDEFDKNMPNLVRHEKC